MGDKEARNKEVVTGSATYEGETKDGMKHGMGTLTWDDGDQVRFIFFVFVFVIFFAHIQKQVFVSFFNKYIILTLFLIVCWRISFR